MSTDTRPRVFKGIIDIFKALKEELRTYINACEVMVNEL